MNGHPEKSNGGFMIDNLLKGEEQVDDPEDEESDLEGVDDIVDFVTKE